MARPPTAQENNATHRAAPTDAMNHPIPVTHRCGHTGAFSAATSAARLERLRGALCKHCQRSRDDAQPEAGSKGGAKAGSMVTVTHTCGHSILYAHKDMPAHVASAAEKRPCPSCARVQADADALRIPVIPHEIPRSAAEHLIPVDAISPSPLNPRRRFGEAALGELAASIRRHGVLEPLVVRRQTGVAKPFSLLAGERRWRAALLAGLAEVPCVIRQAQDDATAISLMLVENLQREDLDPIAQAEAFRRLGELGWTQATIGERIGKSQPVIANAIRLLALPADVRDLVTDGTLSAAHGRALARWNTDPEKCRRMAAQAVDHDLTSRDLEKIATDALNLRAERGLAGAAAPEPQEEERPACVGGVTLLGPTRAFDTEPIIPHEIQDAGTAGGEIDLGRFSPEERSAWHALLDHKRALARQRVRNHAHFERFDILMAWLRLRSLRHGAIRDAARETGLTDPQCLCTTPTSAPSEDATRYLTGLGPILRAQLCALATVLSEIDPTEQFPGSPTPLTDWLLGE